MRGLVSDSKYSINYIASHDGYTLGDFIRIGTREKGKAVHEDHHEHVKLSEEENELHKLAAFILAMSQGIMMLHSGQEFARTKIIHPEDGIMDPNIGQLDHDSYNKDNETNYLNYDDKKINQELFDYYRDLIQLRKAIPELRSADPKQIQVIRAKENEFGLGYQVNSSDKIIAVFVNASPERSAEFNLDEGIWNIHANNEFASPEPRGVLNGGKIELLPRSKYVLIKHK